MATTLELLKQQANVWTAPISAEAPGGRSAKQEPAYEQLLQEVAKLDAMSGGSVDWRVVVERGGELLQRTSKDLLIASYLAYGSLQMRGVEGLATGLVVVAEMMDGYWPSLFPELSRLRGRVNALTWLVDRLSAALPVLQVGSADRDALDALSLALGRLSAVSRERLQAQSPSLRPLTDAVERLKLSLPPETPAVAAPVGAPASVTPAAPPTAVSAAAASPSQVAPAPTLAVGASPALPAIPVQLARPEDAVEYLRGAGTALASTGAALRRADSSSAVAFRLVRTGLWLHVLQAPAVGPTGKTSLPALPANMVTQLEKMAEHGRWDAVLEEAESALVQHRFALDLHRHSARALRALGPSHQAAHAALVAELATFLGRVPALPELLTVGGTPLADAATRDWLAAEVLTRGAAPRAEATAPGGATVDVSEEAGRLAREGKPQEAMALLQAAVEDAHSGAQRFRLRLELAQLCASLGHRPVALGLYEALDREVVTHQLEGWEPALAARCLEGWLGCAKQVKPPPAAAEFATRFQRLCALSPGAALRMVP